ncbi:MAG: hypothetical protein FWF44_07170 [Defluviitaleaceae bacterium]|nr:hypothetical protein [Defluviitaleaceae bacterium]
MTLKRSVNLSLAGRLIFLAILAILVGYMLFSLQGGRAERARQADHITGIIQSALQQCYALEGGYPSDIKYLTRYGVIFDDNSFFYYYEKNGLGNYMPDVRVIPR